MKRHFHLWNQITTFSNLIDAARKAQKGKRYRENVLEFNYNLETEILSLQNEPIDKTYQPGAYKTFEIAVPKRRLISAAPYRDRIVHHALCNIIVPLVEPSLIFDTYANRCYKGSHRALRRFTRYARSSQYVLQLWLIDLLIDNGNEQPEAVFHFPDDDLLSPLARSRGLPIGNLTSQFFANWYLNDFDHWISRFSKSHSSSYRKPKAISTATATTRIGLRSKHRYFGASHKLFTKLGSPPQAWRYP